MDEMSTEKVGSFLSWTGELGVGIPSIDVQHMTFISFINDAYRSMTVPSDIGVIREVLDNLVDYAKIHFTNEEQLFDRYSYPGAADHRKEHENFLACVLAYKQELISDEGHQVPLSVCLFMKSWLTRHIAVSDKKYADYFKEKNIDLNGL